MRHSDLHSFMEAVNPDVQQAYGRDEQRAVLCDAPTMTVIEQAYGENAAAMWLTAQLTDLAVFAGVKGVLNDRQYMQLATMIVTEFGYLKATELMLFFYRLKAGHYGTFYGHIDPMMILENIRRKFLPERATIIKEAESRQHDAERLQRREAALKPDEIKRLKERIQSITENYKQS